MIRVSLKNLAARPLRTALIMCSIVLGVAMVAAAFTVSGTMRTAADSLSASAYDGTDAVVSGRTAFKVGSDDWTVDKPKVSASLLQRVRALPEVKTAVGDITDQNTKVIGADGKPVGGGPYFGLGLDTRTPGFERLTPLRLSAGTWATGPGQVVIDAGTADAQKLHVGDAVRIAFANAATYRVTGIARFGAVKSLGTATVVAFDLHTAQRELGRGATYDNILVGARDGVTPAQLRTAIAGVLPHEAVVQSATANDRFTFDGLRSFIDIIKIVLLIFGGVAIVVGGFTIGNALSMTVAQRSRELGLLRLVGASRRQVLGAVVFEAAVLGVLSSIVGLAVGFGVAKLLLTLLAAFGLELPEVGLQFGAETAIVALLVGTVVTTLAGLLPAWRATRVAPTEVLREAAARQPGRVGRGVRAVVSVIGRPAERLGGSAGFLARRNAMRAPGRTLSTATALTIGVALVTVVTVVASGLKDSATTSLERRISADHVVVGHDGGSPISPATVRDVAAVPGVRSVSTIAQDGALAFDQVEIVNRIDAASIGKLLRFDWKRGDDRVPTALGGTGAIVDSGWASEHQLTVGSPFTLTAPNGTKLALTVRGIEKSPVIDALGLGPVTLSSAAYDRAFTNRKPTLTLVSAEESAVPGMREALRSHPDAKLQTTDDWIADRASSVDQLLAIFMVMLALTVIVSLIGIVNTLLLATFERTRELGMLRAVGMSRRQTRRMVRHESIITAVLGAFTGMAIGLGLAAILTASFASSGLAFSVPTMTLGAFALVAVLAGVGAAIIPARRAARLDPLTALAYE